MKRKRKSVTNQGRVNPVHPAAGAAVARPVRVEHELPLLPVEAAPKDAVGHPIVPTCWVRAAVDGTPYGFPGVTATFTGEVLRVVRVENGKDHGKVLVYVKTEDSGRWGRCAPIECVRVRRKPASVKSDESRAVAEPRPGTR